MIKNRKLYLITILSTLLFVLIFLLTKSGNVLFFANLFLCGIICYKAKISIFSLKSLLINYVLVSVFFQFNTGKSYGILELGLIELHYMEMMLLALVYNFIMYMFIEISGVTKFEKKKILSEHKTSLLSAYACSLIAIISSIIAFPKLPFIDNGERFDALLPGNAWNHVTIIALLLAYPKLGKSWFVKFAYAFCFLWFLLRGERVDMLGLAVFILALSVAKKIYVANKNKLKVYVKYFIIALALVFSLVIIGEIRGGNKTFNFEQISRKVLIQNTAADIGYVYNSSIHYVNEKGMLYGKTYLTYFIEAIPLFSSNYEAAGILKRTYYTPGGILILSEPYMNFGIIGLIVFTLLEMFILYQLIKREKKYNYFIYLFLLITTFRTSWYGLKYIETGLLYILPILYFMTKTIDGWVSKNARKRNISNSSNI